MKRIWKEFEDATIARLLSVLEENPNADIKTVFKKDLASIYNGSSEDVLYDYQLDADLFDNNIDSINQWILDNRFDYCEFNKHDPLCLEKKCKIGILKNIFIHWVEVVAGIDTLIERVYEEGDV